MGGDERVGWANLKTLAGQAFRKALARTLVVVAILVLNPFGIVEWSDLRSRAVWQRIYADYYGSGGRDGRAQITVVELDQLSLDSAAPTDTAPNSIHLLNIFRTIHNDRDYKGDGAKPRALFIDLLLGEFAPDGVSEQQLLDFGSFGDKCPDALGDGSTMTIRTRCRPSPAWSGRTSPR